jgi:peptide/nickel transport system substrate-binding protein
MPASDPHQPRRGTAVPPRPENEGDSGVRFRRKQEPGGQRGLRRASGVLAVAALSALALAGCGNGAAGSASQGGVYRLGSDSSIDSLNPFVAFQADADTSFTYIYPSLVQYSPQMQIVPDFATSWSMSDGGRVWTFHTVKNARWSDGKPLTAQDAAWTFQTILKYQNSATSNSAGYVTDMTSAVAPNPDTLVLTYSQPVANVLAQVELLYVLPEHIWAKYATGNGKGLTTFQNDAPIVSGGPFILTSYTKGQDALFKRNPDFYGPKPHIQGLALEFFTDSDAMITALKGGQLDGLEGVPTTAVGSLKKAGFVVRSTPGDAFDDFIINDNPNQQASHRELMNPLLRQAFSYAIDRQQIVNTVLLGYGQTGGSIIPPATGTWSDPAIKPTPFDVAKANQLLDQAGYKMGPNGIRIANGHPMSYTVIVPDDITSEYGERSFEIVQNDLKQVGVQLTPDVLDNSAAYSALTADSYKNFEMSMWDWYPETDPDFMLSVLTCGEWNTWNDTGFCNKSYDSLFNAQGAAMAPAQRLSLVYQMQQMISQDNTYLVLDYPDSIEAHGTKWTDLPLIGGASWTGQSTIPFEDVHLAG